MLFLLVGLLLIAAVCVLCVRKSRESLFLFGMCVSLMLQFSGILIFIAKKGGYTRDILNFLYFSPQLKTKVQYLYITLDQMGYLIALGRQLFPLFLMQTALHYSMLPVIRSRPWIKRAVCVLPVISLAVYFPSVFRGLTDWLPWTHSVIVQVGYWGCVAYVAAALIMLVVEWWSITIRYFRRQFTGIVVCLMALSGLYLLYCGQDPAQVYHFYSYDYVWNKGLGYMQYAPNMTGFVTLVVVNVICGSLGIWMLTRYTQDQFISSREDAVLERKFDIARSGASVFVHSIKNQLLANRVLEKHIYQELDKPQPDLERIRACVDQMHGANELLLSRSEELYRTVKGKSVRLVPTRLENIVETTRERFRRKYPDAILEIDVRGEDMVLADENYLSEAVYNLLTNAWEANLTAGRGNDPVRLISGQERLYTVLEVRDAGEGIPRSRQRKIFEPFFSSKNSNYSWGMGLYHVRAIVKAHLGSVRVESQPGEGSSFFIMLPRY